MYQNEFDENTIDQMMNEFLPVQFGGPNSPPMPPFGGPGGQPMPPFGGPGGQPMPPFGGPGGQPMPPFGGPGGQGMPPFGGPGGQGMPPFGGPGGQGMPPFGGPGGQPMPPFGGPGGTPMPPPGGPGTTPMAPPPSFTPMMSRSQFGSQGIRQCIYRNTYIWLRNGGDFWFFPTFVTSNVILGFRWGRFGWIFSTVNRDNILTFQCF